MNTRFAPPTDGNVPRVGTRVRRLRRLATFAGVCAGVVLVLAGVQASRQRHGVAYWDIDDIPPLSADLAGKTIAAPAGSLASTSYQAVLPSGLSVELFGVSRNASGQDMRSRSVAARSWTPSGEPYAGEELSGGPNPTTDDESATMYSDREDHGARYLAFRLTSPTDAQVEIYGFVPESAHAGAGAPDHRGFGRSVIMNLQAGTPKKYRTAVVVENDKAGSYALAVGQGPWVIVGAVAGLPSKLENGKTATLAGKWGRLEITAHHYRSYSGPELNPDFVSVVAIPSAEPRDYTYRLTLRDSKGRPLQSNRGLKRMGMLDRVDYPAFFWHEVGSVVVEQRKLTYVEFRNVHYYPDANAWAQMHYDKEGEEGVCRVEGFGRLAGLFEPQPNATPNDVGKVYAPDGKLWMDYPDQDRIRGIRMDRGRYKAPLAGLLELDDAVQNAGDAEVAVFGSDSAAAGRGNLKQLGVAQGPRYVGSSDWGAGGGPSLTWFDRPTQATYVQFRVRVPDSEWRSAGRVRPPAGPFIRFGSPALKGVPKQSAATATALGVALRDEGSLAMYWVRPDGNGGFQKERLIRWDGAGGQARLVAVSKSGKRHVFDWSGGSDTSVSYEFQLGDQSRPSCKSGRVSVFLDDIEAFEVETRAYGPPVWFVAKLPRG